MAIPRNIEIFNLSVARILGLLYDSFPQPMNIGQDHFFDLLDSDGNCLGRDEEEGAIRATLLWLTAEGYLRTQGDANELGSGVILTLRGLTLLRTIPAALDGSGSFADRLKSALEHGSKATVSKLIDHLLENGLKLVAMSGT